MIPKSFALSLLGIAFLSGCNDSDKLATTDEAISQRVDDSEDIAIATDADAAAISPSSQTAAGDVATAPAEALAVEDVKHLPGHDMSKSRD